MRVLLYPLISYDACIYYHPFGVCGVLSWSRETFKVTKRDHSKANCLLKISISSFQTKIFTALASVLKMINHFHLHILCASKKVIYTFKYMKCLKLYRFHHNEHASQLNAISTSFMMHINIIFET